LQLEAMKTNINALRMSGAFKVLKVWAKDSTNSVWTHPKNLECYFKKLIEMIHTIKEDSDNKELSRMANQHLKCKCEYTIPDTDKHNAEQPDACEGCRFWEQDTTGVCSTGEVPDNDDCSYEKQSPTHGLSKHAVEELKKLYDWMLEDHTRGITKMKLHEIIEVERLINNLMVTIYPSDLANFMLYKGCFLWYNGKCKNRHTPNNNKECIFTEMDSTEDDEPYLSEVILDKLRNPIDEPRTFDNALDTALDALRRYRKKHVAKNWGESELFTLVIEYLNERNAHDMAQMCNTDTDIDPEEDELRLIEFYEELGKPDKDVQEPVDKRISSSRKNELARTLEALRLHVFDLSQGPPGGLLNIDEPSGLIIDYLDALDKVHGDGKNTSTWPTDIDVDALADILADAPKELSAK